MSCLLWLLLAVTPVAAAAGERVPIQPTPAAASPSPSPAAAPVAPPSPAATLSPAPAAPAQLSLSQTVALALRRNLELSQAALKPSIDATLARSARGLFDPTGRVRASTGQNPLPAGINPELLLSHDSTISVGAEQRTPSGIRWSAEYFPLQRTGALTLGGLGGQSLNIQADARATVAVPFLRDAGNVNLAPVRRYETLRESNRLGLHARVLDVVAATERAYWAVVLGNRVVDRRRQALEASRAFVETVRSRVQEGSLAPYQLFEAQHSLTMNQVALETAQRELQATKDRLAYLLQVPPSQVAVTAGDGKVDVPAVPLSEALIVEAQGRRPEVGQALKAIAIADIDTQMLRNANRPRLDLILEYWTNSTQASFQGYRLGLEFQVPLSGRSASADTERARLQAREARITLEIARQAVEREIRQACREVESAAARVESARQAAQAAGELLEAEKLRFDTGIISTGPVILATQKVSEAEDLAALAEFESRVARIDLERARGLALERCGVNLDQLVAEALREAREAATREARESREARPK